MRANEPDSAGVALIFGGSRGIGAAIAVRLAQAGYRIALTYVSRPDKAREVAETIAAAGSEAVAVEADSCDPGAIRAAVVGTIERFGGLDVAVVNAGVLRLGTIDELSLEDLDLTLAVNVRGVFLAIQAAAAGMQDGGRVITIGSNTAKRVSRGNSMRRLAKRRRCNPVARLGGAKSLSWRRPDRLAGDRLTVTQCAAAGGRG